MSGMIYIGDNTTESTKCSNIDTSKFIRRSNYIDMGVKKIVNLGDPVEERDALNLKKFNNEITDLEMRMSSNTDRRILAAMPRIETSIEARLRETIVIQNAEFIQRVSGS